MYYADADTSEHYSELIDVATFVNANDISGRDQRLVNNTLERAVLHHEWLLFPMDPMIDGPGYSSRFAMNRHLRGHGCFRERRQ
jgi:hypothetical protein